MLSYNKMLHGHTLALLFLIFTVANIFIIQQVNGDEALIKQICAGTPAPEDCDRCFIQDPDSDKKDEKALAGTAIRCSISQGHIVTEMFAGIRNGSDDSDVKDKCARCEQSIGVAITSLESAESFCRGGRFRDAANQLAVGGYKVVECAELVQDLPVTPAFVEHFILLNNLYMNSFDIVYNLYRKA